MLRHDESAVDEIGAKVQFRQIHAPFLRDTIAIMGEMELIRNLEEKVKKKLEKRT